MRRVIFLCTIACCVISLQAQESKDKLKNVAVIEFQKSGGFTSDDVITLTNRFRAMLFRTNAFTVIERGKMDEILKEQDFVMSDNCTTNECAVQVGKILGVEYMIAGDIGKIGETYTIDLRMIDVSTSKLVQTQSRDFVGKVDGLLEIMKNIAVIFAEAGTGKGSSGVYRQFSEDDDVTGPLKDNIVYLECYGSPTTLGSVNFERRIIKKLYIRGGVGLNDISSPESFPLTVGGLIGKRSHHLELAGGVTYSTEDGLYVTALIGYRYQAINGIFVRIGFGAFYNPKNSEFASFPAGLAVGYGF